MGKNMLWSFGPCLIGMILVKWSLAPCVHVLCLFINPVSLSSWYYKSYRSQSVNETQLKISKIKINV